MRLHVIPKSVVLPVTTILFFCVPSLALTPRQAPCENPSIRKEWGQLSLGERDQYIKAVSCLATKPSTIRLTTTWYDDFTWVHREIFDEGMPLLHQVETARKLILIVHISSNQVLAQFLPWHRYFGHIYETALKQCGYTGPLPYWDWAASSSNPLHALVLAAPPNGLGPDGVASKKCLYNPQLPARCVASGPFAALRPAYYNAGTREHSLHRCYTCASPTMRNESYTYEEVDRIQSIPGFEEYGREMFSGPHQAIHDAIGGDFPKVSSPNDPIFFLHHAQVDRLWYKWQHADIENRQWQYEGFSQPLTASTLSRASIDDRVRMLGLAADLDVIDLMDTQNGLLCYRYED